MSQVLNVYDLPKRRCAASFSLDLRQDHHTLNLALITETVQSHGLHQPVLFIYNFRTTCNDPTSYPVPRPFEKRSFHLRPDTEDFYFALLGSNTERANSICCQTIPRRWVVRKSSNFLRMTMPNYHLRRSPRLVEGVSVNARSC